MMQVVLSVCAIQRALIYIACMNGCLCGIAMDLIERGIKRDQRGALNMSVSLHGTNLTQNVSSFLFDDLPRSLEAEEKRKDRAGCCCGVPLWRALQEADEGPTKNQKIIIRRAGGGTCLK